MKKRETLKAVMVAVLAMFSVSQYASADSCRVAVHRNSDKLIAASGTDVGNGDGDNVRYELPSYERGRFPHWCGMVSTWLRDTLHEIENAPPAEARDYMVASIEDIMAAYEKGDIDVQPITYSLLGRMQKMDGVFPSCAGNKGGRDELGDQSAAIVIAHLLKAASEVNDTFDREEFLDYYEFRSCKHRRCRDYDREYDMSSLYVPYIKSARKVLGEFFEPAFCEVKDGVTKCSSYNVLEAMAKDEWELKAVRHILDWMITDISKDVFSRPLQCVLFQVERVRDDLQDYLNGIVRGRAKSPRAKRFSLERSLSSLLSVLDDFDNENVGHSCSSHKPRRLKDKDEDRE